MRSQYQFFQLNFKITILIFFISLNIGFCQHNIEEYLNVNYISTSQIDSNCFGKNKYRLFIAGEKHYSNGNRYIELEIFKRLYYNMNVRVLFLESSSYTTKLIKQYFNSEDILEIDYLCNIAFGKNDIETRFYFEELRKFWRQLPENEKFEVLGVDIENSPVIIIEILYQQLPKSYFDTCCLSEKNIEEIIRMKNKKKLPSNRKVLNLLNNILIDENNDPEKYRFILKENYDSFFYIVKSSILGLKSGKYYNSNSLISREEFLFLNIKEQMDAHPNVNYFGQFGRAHATISNQKEWLHLKDWNSFTSKFNTSTTSPVKGQVCSFMYFYPSDAEEDNHKTIIKVEDIPFFMKYSNSPITIFKLDSPETPFKEMSEKFQYLIINKY